ncbi:MAG: hypothetical protein SFU86_24710 [Pirellulaceae bacterium]|nr:hypothetical protein [Pirellulaceae bacterium]
MRRIARWFIGKGTVLALVFAARFSLADDAPPPEEIDNPLLPNAYRVVEKVISGGLPEGDEAFAALKKLGIKTIISVDGAKPDVATAKKFGLRYVHLPHGYDGIPAERGRALAKGVRDLPGPIYLHCHHGKHRSPAASAVACVAAGLLPADSALGVLQAAGTSENYRGLYQSAREARRVPDETLDQLVVEFPETAKIPALAGAMVEIEHAFDNLKVFQAAGWKPLPKQPALDPAHEALLVKEHYHELLRRPEVRREPASFQQILRDGEKAAESLETALRAWLKAPAATPPEEIGRAFTEVDFSCATCHRQFRDVPLGEKQKR